MSPIPGVSIENLSRIPDSRGFFSEVARSSSFETTFVQMNHSHSRVGVLRGLHYHRKQADLWYVMNGEAQIVLADLRDRHVRPAVQTFTSSGDDPCTIYIPPGVAHGYLALTDVDVLYWVTDYYDSTDEYGVAWNDPSLAIAWAVDDPVLSERDRANPFLDG